MALDAPPAVAEEEPLGGSMALDVAPAAVATVEETPLRGSMPLDVAPAAIEEVPAAIGQSTVADAEAPPSDVAGIRDATPVFTEQQDELLDCAQQCLRDVVLEAGDTPLDLKGLFERCTARARRAASEEKAAPAATPAAVTSAITLRGAQLAYAVLHGAKRVENRHFSMRPGWYALHVGAKTGCHSSQEPLLQAVAAMPPEAALSRGAVVGAVRVSHSLPLEDCSGVLFDRRVDVQSRHRHCQEIKRKPRPQIVTGKHERVGDPR